MAISAASLKWYPCTTQDGGDGDAHGGDINTSTPITSNLSENIFDNVTDAERQSGDIEYRKIYFRNENSDTYTAPTFWIDSNTPASNSDISICLAGTKSTTSNPVALTGTATFAASTTVTGAGTSFLTEVAPGEKVFNSTDDTESAGKIIASIESDTSLTLTEAYSGTTGSSKGISVAGGDNANFTQPANKGAGLVGENDLVQYGYQGIWIKRDITGSGDGYTDDVFTISCENA